jgi:protein-disulfide isomerase
VTWTPVSVSGSLYSLGLFAAFTLVAGCHPRGSDHASPGDASPESPCSRLAAEVCKETAEDPETCSALKTTVDLLSPAACAMAIGDPDALRGRLAERKRRCAELATRLCHDVGERTRACKMVREQTNQFAPTRCIGMLDKYAEVLTNLKQRDAQRMLPPEKVAELTAGEPPSFGPIDARLQLVEFIDFENRDCVHAAAIVRELKARYGDQLHFVVRQFPLPYNPHAHLAAEAALAADAQGKFWELHDRMLANRQRLDRASLEDDARELQLDVKPFQAALDHRKYTAAVDADVALGNELSVVGMPTMFLNGERLPNAVDQQGIIDAIEERLSDAN